MRPLDAEVDDAKVVAPGGHLRRCAYRLIGPPAPQAADRLVTTGIDRHVRGWEKPSDHVPVYADLDIG